MIRIAIVDDRMQECAKIETYIETVSKQLHQKVEVEPYTSSSSFLHAIQNNHEAFHLIFLDIELDEKTGIDIAQHIRYVMQDELQQIVYISGNSTYSLSLHDTHPLDFLVKPIEQNAIEKILQRYLKIAGLWTDTFSYQVAGDVITIKLKNIRYFQVVDKTIAVYTIDGVDYFKGSLNEIAEKLRKFNFLHIHRSYLVNPVYIKIFEYDKVILSDGFGDTHELPIGSAKRAEICKMRMEWLRQKGG